MNQPRLGQIFCLDQRRTTSDSQVGATHLSTFFDAPSSSSNVCHEDFISIGELVPSGIRMIYAFDQEGSGSSVCDMFIQRKDEMTHGHVYSYSRSMKSSDNENAWCKTTALLLYILFVRGIYIFACVQEVVVFLFFLCICNKSDTTTAKRYESNRSIAARKARAANFPRGEYVLVSVRDVFWKYFLESIFSQFKHISWYLTTV